MTSIDHKTGTDRIHEAITKIKCHEEDLIINVQGDEPFISHDDINTLIPITMMISKWQPYTKNLKKRI